MCCQIKRDFKRIRIPFQNFHFESNFGQENLYLTKNDFALSSKTVNNRDIKVPAYSPPQMF